MTNIKTNTTAYNNLRATETEENNLQSKVSNAHNYEDKLTWIIERMTYSSFLYLYSENSDAAWDILGACSTLNKAFKHIQTLSPKVHKDGKHSKYEYIDDSTREFTRYRIRPVPRLDERE